MEAQRMVIDNISPQAQAWLQTEAERNGMQIENYVARLIEATAAGMESDLVPGSREWDHVLHEGFISAPPVSLAQMDRESLYSDDLSSDSEN